MSKDIKVGLDLGRSTLAEVFQLILCHQCSVSTATCPHAKHAYNYSYYNVMSGLDGLILQIATTYIYIKYQQANLHQKGTEFSQPSKE